MTKKMNNKKLNLPGVHFQTQEEEHHQDLEVGEDQVVVVNEIVFE